MQSVTITTKVVSLIPTHGKVYFIQHNVIKYVSDLPGLWFPSGAPVCTTNKTDGYKITEILLKVALNTILITLTAS